MPQLLQDVITQGVPTTSSTLPGGARTTAPSPASAPPNALPSLSSSTLARALPPSHARASAPTYYTLPAPAAAKNGLPIGAHASAGPHSADYCNGHSPYCENGRAGRRDEIRAPCDAATLPPAQQQRPAPPCCCSGTGTTTPAAAPTLPGGGPQQHLLVPPSQRRRPRQHQQHPRTCTAAPGSPAAGLAQWPALEARLSRLARAHINSRSRRTVDVHTLLAWARDLYVQLYCSTFGRAALASDDDEYEESSDEECGECEDDEYQRLVGQAVTTAFGQYYWAHKRAQPQQPALRKSTTIVPQTRLYLAGHERRASAPAKSGVKNTTDEDFAMLYENEEGSRCFFDIVEEEHGAVPSITEAMIVDFVTRHRIQLLA